MFTLAFRIAEITHSADTRRCRYRTNIVSCNRVQRVISAWTALALSNISKGSSIRICRTRNAANFCFCILVTPLWTDLTSVEARSRGEVTQLTAGAIRLACLRKMPWGAQLRSCRSTFAKRPRHACDTSGARAGPCRIAILSRWAWVA